MASFDTLSFWTDDGLRIAISAAGPVGAPLVTFLHGGGQTRHSWDGAMRRVAAQGYRALSYDARGHGESDWSPAGDYSVSALASDLRSILAGFEGPAALVGASLGGITSFYAIGRADVAIARALVMVDIVLRPSPEGVERIRRFMTANPRGFANIDEAVDAVASYNPSRPRPANPEGLLRNLRRRGDGRFYWHWDPQILDRGARADSPSMGDQLEAVSGHVTIPTLLVKGGQSDIVEDEAVDDMRRLVPQMEVADIPGAGHMVAGDRNDAFNSEIVDFLLRNHPL